MTAFAPCLLAALLAAQDAPILRERAAPPEPAPATVTPRPGPPDPRRGEPLDGRPPAPPSEPALMFVPRLVLLPVRSLAWVVLRPLDAAVGALERRKVYQRLYETFTSDDRLIGVRPSLEIQAGLAGSAGLRYFDRRSLGAGSLLEAGFRVGPQSYRLELRAEPPGATGLGLRAIVDQRRDAVYGGPVGLTRDELEDEGLDVVRYTERAVAVNLAFVRSPTPFLTVGATAGFNGREYGNGEATSDDPAIRSVYCVDRTVSPCLVDPGLVPGFDEGVRLAKGTLALDLDTRPDLRYGSGLLGRAEASYAHGVAGDISQHVTAIAGLGGALGARDRLLTAFLRAGVVEPLGRGPVPFDELLSASGVERIRGLPRGRLRGRSMVVGTVEYHWLAAPWMDTALTLDAGNSYGAWFDGFAVQDSFTSIGLAFLIFDPKDRVYWSSQPWFGVHFAVVPQERVSLAFSLYAW